MKIWLVIIAVLIASVVSAEEKKYITDQCKISVRSGQSTKHKILRLLKSGTEVTVLSMDLESGYANVKMANNSEGWVLARQLMTMPSARDQIIRIKKNIETYQNQEVELRELIDQLKARIDVLSTEKKVKLEENTKLNNELDQIRQTAASALSMAKRLKEIQQHEDTMNINLQKLTQENKMLSDSTTMTWFIIGAVTLGFGFFAGLILPRINFSRKSGWDSF